MKTKRVMKLRWGILLVAFGVSLGAPGKAQAQTESVLYSFTNSNGDGASPQAGLIMDSSGNLYGTTAGGGASGVGTVFELVYSNGSYTEKVLYSFTNSNGDGAYPQAGLIMDSSGNLYGTTGTGGSTTSTLCPLGCGTVFELVNSSGSYTESVLYSFTGSNGDGATPHAGLIMDSSGNLYGTTSGGGASGHGTVFELVYSNGSYTEKVLYSFTNSNGDGGLPCGGLITDSSGNLYGTTMYGGVTSAMCYGDSCGTVFELVNSSGSYTETVLHRFTNSNGDGAGPQAGLIMDSSGNLYGTTPYGGGASGFGNGTVFELVNSSGSYTEKVLYSFTNSNGDGANPQAGLIMDSSGNLYGTTGTGGSTTSTLCPLGCGTVFELVNSSGSYTESVLYSFTGSNGDGATPHAGLIMDSSGNLYGTTSGGGASASGTVFELSVHAGTTTTLTSSLNPASAGDSVVFTATVTSASGTPAGSVTFSSGSTTLGTTTLTSGRAIFTVEDATALGMGTYTITAQYTPAQGAPFAGSTGTLSQTVTEAGVAVTTGNNTFLGNQTVIGTVSATNFVGDGSGLTGITVPGSAVTGQVASAATALTALSLAFSPTQCGANMFSTGIAANGNANCSQPASANLSDYATLVFNTQANTFTGGKQTLPASATGYASLNLPNTGAAPTTPAMGDVWLTTADPHLMFLDNTNTTQRLAFMSDVSSLDSGLLGGNNTFTGSNTFSQIIKGSIAGNAGTVTNGVYTTGSYANPIWITALSGSIIAGPVASATIAASATTALTAANATALGGVVAANYARLDIGNSFNGNQAVTGNVSVTGNSATTGTVTIGSGGTPITEHLSVLVNPSLPRLLPLACASVNVTLTGAADGDTIALGVPNGRMTGGANILYTAWVSAANTVTIRACNIDSLAPQKTAGSGSIRVDLWKH